MFISINKIAKTITFTRTLCVEVVAKKNRKEVEDFFYLFNLLQLGVVWEDDGATIAAEAVKKGR